MNILLIIAAIFIATETISPEVNEGKEIQKKEVVAETVETKTSEEIISESQAAAEAKAAAEAEAKAAAEEINYLKIALYIVLLLAVLSGALLYFKKRDKTPLESKTVPPERKEEQPVKEDIQPETKGVQPIKQEVQPEIKEEQPMEDTNKEPTNFEDTNEEEKK
tara:strand:- start:57 stop:548 length:492 start_codon:yes stop_codon:yes gene_type:complete